MTPYAIRTLHLPPSTAMLGSVTLGITGCLGALAGGALADRWGIKTVAIAPRLFFMIALFPVMSFLVANPGAATLFAAIAILSLSHAMSVAVGVILIPLSSPPPFGRPASPSRIRSAWRIFGGTATYVVTWLVGVTGNPLASTHYVMAANVVMLAAVLLAPSEDVDLRQWPPPASREV